MRGEPLNRLNLRSSTDLEIPRFGFVISKEVAVEGYTMRCEITLEVLRNSHTGNWDSLDWAEAFGEGIGGNCTQDIESLDGTSTDPCLRKDVVRILGAVNGENDGEEWVGVFVMRDGRFLSVVASCDYTGWDCLAGNTMTVASSLESLLETGLTPDQKKRLYEEKVS